MPSYKGQQNEFRVVEWRRRAEVLPQPKLPCLSRYHTINLTAGCPNECVYCYTQTYRHHPGWGKVAFYSNMLERLREELPEMKRKPVMVYCSTSSEPFLPHAKILDHMYEIMALLLDAGAMLLISTKGVIEDRFVELFGRYPGKVQVQVGLTTMDDGIRRMLEPRAASVEERKDNLRRLLAGGVKCEVRMDPLFPGLTDTGLSFDSLLFGLSELGVRSAVASFLFLRWGISLRRDMVYGDWSYAEMVKLYTDKITKYCGGGTIKVPPKDYRLGRYADLQELGHANVVQVGLCACKNPDLTDACCHPQP